jgi:hypothetical protein
MGGSRANFLGCPLPQKLAHGPGWRDEGPRLAARWVHGPADNNPVCLFTPPNLILSALPFHGTHSPGGGYPVEGCSG